MLDCGMHMGFNDDVNNSDFFRIEIQNSMFPFLLFKYYWNRFKYIQNKLSLEHIVSL